MPGPSERVVLDTALARTLADRLRDLRDLLGRWARAVVALLGPLGWPADPTAALRAGAGWADGSAAALTRRISLAEAADETASPPSAPGISGTAEGFKTAGRLLVVTLRPDPFRGDADAARAAGARLGTALVGAALAPTADLATLTAIAARLRAAAHDPDLLVGVVTAVGPSRLAAILRLAERVSGGGFTVTATAAGYQVGPARGGDRGRPDAPGRWLPAAVAGELTATLGAALAAFSRSGRLTAGWLGRFNARGTPGEAETTLLGPLLAAGRFSPATLRLLGDALFTSIDLRGDRFGTRAGTLTNSAGRGAGTPAMRDIGWYGGDRGGRRRAAYGAAVLRAIADEPALAARFAGDHVETILAGSRLSALPLATGVPAPVSDAWQYLVSRAGGRDARRADPAGAATFMARLGFAVFRYQAEHTDPRRRTDTSWPLPAGLRAVFADLLHVWRAEQYASAASLLPAAEALRDPSGDGLVASWPGEAAGDRAAGPWATHLAGPADGTRIPSRVWAALLGEALAAGGPAAEILASDAAGQAASLEQAGWLSTRGYRGDSRVAYPASPRALVHLQQAAMVAFFLTTLGDTVTRLALRAELAAGEEARRATMAIDQLAAVAKAIKVNDVLGSLYGIAQGVVVTGVADAAKPDGGPSPATLAAVTRVADTAAVPPGWQDAYRTSATAVWLRRADDPIAPVDVVDATGTRRTYTGDPRADGFITGPADDFLDTAACPLPPERMSPAQRSAYLRWLASPAIVANNDNIPAAPS